MPVEPFKDELIRYFRSRSDVAFAVLFGSAATHRMVNESDIDIAVYFFPSVEQSPSSDSKELMDLENPEAVFTAEEEIWAACEDICRREVDPIVLNRAPATLAASALLTGEELAVRHGGLYRAYFNTVVSLAEEYRSFTEEYVAIKERSRSLSPVDRERLIRSLDYLHEELEDAELYQQTSRKRYEEDKHFRRALER